MHKLFVCWTIDWQDNYLWDRQDFVNVSWRIQALASDLLQSKVTWLAEVDDLTDITRHKGVRQLVEMIGSEGGDIGIHVHHTSVEPKVRKEHFERAVRRVEQAGGHPTAYVGGMGNYIDFDTQSLVGFGPSRAAHPAWQLCRCNSTARRLVPPGEAGAPKGALSTRNAGFGGRPFAKSCRQRLARRPRPGWLSRSQQLPASS